VDPSGDGGGGLTATGLLCASCGTELPPNSKFCDECGAAVATATTPAEYKQVTVLFAGVVHLMHLATAVVPSVDSVRRSWIHRTSRGPEQMLECRHCRDAPALVSLHSRVLR
jgi:hypothetical protein